jgi:hypothetical protein
VWRGLSLMTDDVASGKIEEPDFRRSVVWLTGAAWRAPSSRN